MCAVGFTLSLRLVALREICGRFVLVLLGVVVRRGKKFFETLCWCCVQSNPENTVGVLTMAGKGVRVLVTPTSDLGKILACMHGASSICIFNVLFILGLWLRRVMY